MNAGLRRDLGAFETGEFSSEDLVGRHGEEASSLVALHERLAFAALHPVPDAEAGWAALAPRLDDHPVAPVVHLHAKPRRRMLLVAAATLMLGGTALAVTGDSDEGVVRSMPPPELARGPGAGRLDAEPLGGKVRRHPQPDEQPTVDGGGEGPEQGPSADHQGTHPGKGNDGTDNGSDSDPASESDPDSDPKDEEGSEEGGSQEDYDESDQAEDDEGEPGDFGKGGKASPTEDPEEHEKPAPQGKPSPLGKPSH